MRKLLNKLAFWNRPWWVPFWYIVNQPEVGDTAYKRGLLFIGHFGLGEVVCALLFVPFAMFLPPLYAALVFAVIPAGYHRMKEKPDVAHGGSVRDGNEDTFGLAVGCWHRAALLVAPALGAPVWAPDLVIYIGAAYIAYVLDRYLRAEWSDA